MGPRHKFTFAEDSIIRREVVRTPENILFACCRAAAIIFHAPELANLKGMEANLNKVINRVRHRWYNHLSVSNSESVQRRGGQYLMLLHSDSRTGRNRKVQARGRELLIPIVRTPAGLQRRASQELRDYLNYGTE